MEKAKQSLTGDKSDEENPSPNSPAGGEAESVSESAPQQPSRVPFTSLSQVDADLALARTLQEQERAYMMLRLNDGAGSDYAGSETGTFAFDDVSETGTLDYEVEFEHSIGDIGTAGNSDYGEDAFDANDLAINPAEFDCDEAFARALQNEERELAIRLMALTIINDWGEEDHGDRDGNSQDILQEGDPDELSNEELVALGEVVGTESKGLSADTISALPLVNYKAQSAQDGSNDQCVICQLDYEDDDSLVVLLCKHTYHPECINKWLQMNKVCPVCSAEVSTSENRQA